MVPAAGHDHVRFSGSVPLSVALCSYRDFLPNLWYEVVILPAFSATILFFKVCVKFIPICFTFAFGVKLIFVIGIASLGTKVCR